MDNEGRNVGRGELKEDVDMNVEFENGNCYFGEHVNSVPHGKLFPS